MKTLKCPTCGGSTRFALHEGNLTPYCDKCGKFAIDEITKWANEYESKRHAQIERGLP